MDIRKRVKIPGVDEQDAPDFYANGPKGHEPLNKTALREAERKYKSKSNLDLSEVIDFSHENIPGVKEELYFKCAAYGQELDCCGYSVEGKEGFLYFPSALPEDLQKKFVEAILKEYIVSENESNLHPFYEISKHGLYNSGNQEILSKRENKPSSLGKHLLRKLRWVTIGYKYDWTTKEYNFEKPHLPISPELSAFCKSFACGLGYSDYKAEAGIVNFYQPEDTLTCHVDRSEKNMEPPLISLSFGLDCIFLLGGETRDDKVHAIRVKSGDISVLAGKSRSFFHGIPRILSETNTVEFPDSHEFMQSTRINLNIRQVF